VFTNLLGACYVHEFINPTVRLFRMCIYMSYFIIQIIAPMILRMLQHTFTTKLFWNGIRKYLHMQAQM